ncbi:hypothetical protein [Streptomyces antibioticus]|uniref:hypothetical protein n=1 Tax=Streptomyces antibioticus TaxID=1890 RepID=UPI0033FA4029
MVPLSVPLVLVPGDPDRFYTVHVQRAHWDADTVTEKGPLALEDAAREGLRFVSECLAAELTEADVELIACPDGSAKAVARVLCDEESCAAVAERYQRDAAEDAEAEAARKWAAGKLVDHEVQLLRTPDRSAEVIFAALMAAQEHRAGGAPRGITLMVDEVAELAARVRAGTLFPDRTPDEVREEIERLIRTGRKPSPVQRESAQRVAHRVTDVDSAADLTTWVGPARGSMTPTLTADGRPHLDLPNAAHMTPEHLVRETETLARSVIAGETRSVGVKRLAELCGELARRHDAEPQPRPCPGPGGCREDDDPTHNLVHRIGHRPRAVTAGEVRAARITTGPMMPLHTLPETVPDDDAALVLVYRKDTPGLGLLDALLSGSENAVQGAITGTLRWLTADGK